MAKTIPLISNCNMMYLNFFFFFTAACGWFGSGIDNFNTCVVTVSINFSHGNFFGRGNTCSLGRYINIYKSKSKVVFFLRNRVRST